MARAVKTYMDCGFSGPVRVDHVPTMAGERNDTPGYAHIGRLYAIGYLKGIIDAVKGFP
jgi:mannonate dehydratase